MCADIALADDAPPDLIRNRVGILENYQVTLAADHDLKSDVNIDHASVPVSPPPRLSLPFPQALMRDHIHHHNATAFLTAVLSVLVAVSLLIWLPVTWVAVWLMCVLVCQGISMRLCRSCQKTGLSGKNLVRRARLIVVAEIATGVVWAFLIILIEKGGIPVFNAYLGEISAVSHDGNSAGDHIFIYLALIIVVTLRLTRPSHYLPFLFAASLPITLTTVFIASQHVDVLHVGIALCALCAQVHFINSARHANDATMKRIKLVRENAALLSELDLAKSQAEKAHTRAEQNDPARSRFLANMTHDLHTPLNKIIRVGEIMKDDIKAKRGRPPYKRYGKDIYDQGHKLLKSLNQIFDLSRLEAGRYEMIETHLQIEDIARECLNLNEMTAKDHGLKITEDFEANLPSLRGDDAAIRQIWLNLIANAIRFTAKGGTIELKVARTPYGGLGMSVRDTGCGIDTDDLEQIVDIFRADTRPGNNEKKGIGLGLALVRELMRLHDGFFEIASEIDQGTEVIIIFPPERTRSKPANINIGAEKSLTNVNSETGDEFEDIFEHAEKLRA